MSEKYVRKNKETRQGRCRENFCWKLRRKDYIFKCVGVPLRDTACL